HAYIHPHVLVIDEIGYLSLRDNAANVLFQVVNERYLQKKPMLFTANKPLAAWGQCFMIRISPRPSSIGASSAAVTSSYAAPATAPVTCGQRRNPSPRRPLTLGQNFRKK